MILGRESRAFTPQGGRHGTALDKVGPASDRLVHHWTGPKSYHCLKAPRLIYKLHLLLLLNYF